MPVNVEDFDEICKELEELKQKNNELLEEFSKNENSNKIVVALQIFFSIAFVASIFLAIFSADNRDVIMILVGLVTAAGSLYGLFYNEI